MQSIKKQRPYFGHFARIRHKGTSGLDQKSACSGTFHSWTDFLFGSFPHPSFYSSKGPQVCFTQPNLPLTPPWILPPQLPPEVPQTFQLFTPPAVISSTFDTSSPCDYQTVVVALDSESHHINLSCSVLERSFYVCNQRVLFPSYQPEPV